LADSTTRRELTSNIQALISAAIASLARAARSRSGREAPIAQYGARSQATVFDEMAAIAGQQLSPAGRNHGLFHRNHLLVSQVAEKRRQGHQR
jgi:hypothetical protein